MKKRLVIGMLTAIVSLSLVGCAPKQIKDSVTIEAGKEYYFNTKDFFSSADGIRFNTVDVDTSRVGEYEVTATYKNKEYNITVKVEDTTAPEFELAQDSIVTNDVGSLDAESLIASVEDVSKTTAELKFDEEPKEDGDYTASVVVTDEYGNSAEKSISVALDTTAPVISGVKDETVSVEPTVESLHYTAEDSRDGEVSVETSIEKTGDNEYTVTAVAKDEAGNGAKETAILTLEKKTTSNESKSTGKSNSGKGSSNSQAESQPAQEAPATQPEVQPGQLDGSSLVTEEGQLGYGETLAPDHHVCPVCGFETDDANEYVTHLREVHNMQV